MEESKETAKREEQERKVEDEHVKDVLERSAMETDELPSIPPGKISGFSCKFDVITLQC